MVRKKIIIILALFSLYTAQLKSHPLNILFVVEYFPSLSQIYILNMITGLIDQGHQVSIFAFRKSTDPYMDSRIAKYQLLDSVIYEKFPEQLPDSNIVFCQFGILGRKILEMPCLSEWLKKRKVVVCFRGFDLMRYVKQPFHVNKHIFETIDLFLPVCDYFQKRLIGLGCDHKKIKVHHSAIDCEQFFFKIRQKPDINTINFVSIGRFIKKKGLDYAIKAFAEVAKKNSRVHYGIIGDGPEQNYLKTLIKELGIEDKVTLHGWKSQEEIVSLLNSSHIFLLPSVTQPDGNEEGIANALKEAMAMGLISIATWHAGTPELIEHGVSGFLVPERNVSQLVSTIDYIIEHPEIWKSVGLAGRKKIEDEFETKKSIRTLEKIFYALLNNKKKK